MNILEEIKDNNFVETFSNSIKNILGDYIESVFKENKKLKEILKTANYELVFSAIKRLRDKKDLIPLDFVMDEKEKEIYYAGFYKGLLVIEVLMKNQLKLLEKNLREKENEK